MIERPHGPNFSRSDREDLLRSMGRALTLSGAYGASAGFNSAQYRRAQALRDAIRAIATDLTDDPYYYGAQLTSLPL